MQNVFSTLNEVQHQYRWLKEMQDTQPVWLDEESGCWHLFRYADVNLAITDYTTFSSERRQQFRAIQNAARRTNGEQHAVEASREGRSILVMDPPEHRQYRNLVTSAFTPRAIDRLRERVASIAQDLLAEHLPNGKMDFATDFAYPLPTIVIAEMLGVPSSDRPLFKRWADLLLEQQLSDAEFFRPDEQLQSNPQLQRFGQTIEEMSDYFRQMLEERKRKPREDMMSDLLAASIDGEHLDIQDTINFCTILLLAGHITTTNLLGQAIRCFDEYPATLERVRQQPALIPDAIEEVLRFSSPVWRLVRTTRAEVTISGVTIPQDALVFTWLAAANRDPRQFTDPERFDITRTPNKHVAFGHGIHFCIGAPLSRMEASVALPIIITQLSNLHVDRDHAELFAGRSFFGFKHLPITFDA